MIRTAWGPILWYLNLTGFDGWASLWGVAYVRPGMENQHGLIRHEITHLMQMDRDGKVVFMVKYIWWLLRYGYHGDHPYEVEARLAQNDYRSDGA